MGFYRLSSASRGLPGVKGFALVSMAALAMGVAAPAAEAASYNSRAVHAAFSWGKHHHPRNAAYVQVQCSQLGYRLSECDVAYTMSDYSMCDSTVTVSGRSFYVRRTDTTC
jgi:hypothetical protein